MLGSIINRLIYSDFTGAVKTLYILPRVVCTASCPFRAILGKLPIEVIGAAHQRIPLLSGVRIQAIEVPGSSFNNRKTSNLILFLLG